MLSAGTNAWEAVAGIVRSYLLPSALAVGFFLVALLPAVADVQPWSGLIENRTPAFVIATSAVALLLATFSRPLAQVLEGYYLPTSVRERWVLVQRDRLELLRQELNDPCQALAIDLERRDDPSRTRSLTELVRARMARRSPAPVQWAVLRRRKGRDEWHRREVAEPAGVSRRRVAARDALLAYPTDRAHVLPTRFGNALRAGETYGTVQYGLSTLALWDRLTAVASDAVLRPLAQAEAMVWFHVATAWLSLVLAGMSVVVAVWGDAPAYLAWVPLLLGLIPVWYRFAVSAAGPWAQAMRTLVDLNRTTLAAALGLRLPMTLAEERALWSAVTSFVTFGPDFNPHHAAQPILDAHLVERGAPLPPPEATPPTITVVCDGHHRTNGAGAAADPAPRQTTA